MHTVAKQPLSVAPAVTSILKKDPKVHRSSVNPSLSKSPWTVQAEVQSPDTPRSFVAADCNERLGQ